MLGVAKGEGRHLVGLSWFRPARIMYLSSQISKDPGRFDACVKVESD